MSFVSKENNISLQQVSGMFLRTVKVYPVYLQTCYSLATTKNSIIQLIKVVEVVKSENLYSAIYQMTERWYMESHVIIMLNFSSESLPGDPLQDVAVEMSLRDRCLSSATLLAVATVANYM